MTEQVFLPSEGSDCVAGLRRLQGLGVTATAAETGDEAAVDLHPVDRQPLQSAEARIAGSEVVDGDGDAKALQPAQTGDAVAAFGRQEHLLGHLELEPAQIAAEAMPR